MLILLPSYSIQQKKQKSMESSHAMGLVKHNSLKIFLKLSQLTTKLKKISKKYFLDILKKYKLNRI